MWLMISSGWAIFATLLVTSSLDQGHCPEPAACGAMRPVSQMESQQSSSEEPTHPAVCSATQRAETHDDASAAPPPGKEAPVKEAAAVAKSPVARWRAVEFLRGGRPRNAERPQFWRT